MPRRFSATVVPPPERGRNGYGLDPLLVPDGGAAALISVSQSHFQAMEAAGQIGPTSVRFGRSKRWPVCEMQRWVEAGCPSRVRWLQECERQ